MVEFFCNLSVLIVVFFPNREHLGGYSVKADGIWGVFFSLKEGVIDRFPSDHTAHSFYFYW